jgi:hypothetical protein
MIEHVMGLQKRQQTSAARIGQFLEATETNNLLETEVERGGSIWHVTFGQEVRGRSGMNLPGLQHKGTGILEIKGCCMKIVLQEHEEKCPG